MFQQNTKQHLLGVYLLAFCLCAMSGDASAGDKADLVIIIKSARILSLYKGEHLLGSYPVAFGANPVGHKQQEGDERTPEGRYVLDLKKADSAFHRAIHISYPNAQDMESAKKRGVSPGGSIMIHGQKNGYGWASFITQFFNWTDGCVALSNEDMDVLWEAVDAGTPIEIKP
ncbi:MAG: L,D-transpeptidase family protein [Nitrospira sp.]|nr:L,D-transpeptidase family protein [Nitrospira sp.]